MAGKFKRKFFLLLALAWIVAGCGGGDLQTQGDFSEESNFIPEISFFTFGDWGTGGSDQLSVAQALSSYCQVESCDFGLLLGDNFYDSGVSSVDDPQWQMKFEEMYADLDLPFYAALGNHDHLGNAQAQIDYTMLQDRWKMPDRQYSVRFPEGVDPPLLEIFVVDSDTFGGTDGTDLGNSLNVSNANWKVLAIHHPFYSNGSHGDTEFLQDTLLPIACAKVDLVLSGHDHLFSHLSDAGDGCLFHQVVAGTGGKSLYNANSDDRVHFSLSAFGFTTVELDGNHLRVRFYDTDGLKRYAFELRR